MRPINTEENSQSSQGSQMGMIGKGFGQDADLSNVPAEWLCIASFPDSIAVGDFFHTKGQRITNWGTTWKVEKVTPKTITASVHRLWFPVFSNHPTFGRIANGECQNDVLWMKEHEAAQKGKRMQKFWKNGKRFGDSFESHVIVMKPLSPEA